MPVYGAICLDSFGNVLLVKGRRSNKWSFPKGHKKRGETYIECALRETFEEAGICLDPYIPVGYQRLSVGEYYFYELDCEVAPSINDNNEIIDARWMTVEEMRREECNVDVNNFLSRLRKKNNFFRPSLDLMA
jgi:8-oxo-dGTP pyrophosphatase MutT (NUDIX family)